MQTRFRQFAPRLARSILPMFLMVPALIGCGGSPGPERASIHGKVSFDGDPVSRGMIVFLPAEGTNGPSSGAEIKDGEYTIPEATGPVPGGYRVEITATREEGNQTAPGVGGATGGPSGAFTGPSVTMYIPTKYNRDTELQCDVSSGKNELDFELTGAP
jgi:hypothetical protein